MSSALFPKVPRIRIVMRNLLLLQVDPITGHSTLDAGELGLPANSSELITAAVQSSRPQPVGAFSSSVAVKPTSGKSTDLSNIMGEMRLFVPGTQHRGVHRL